MKRTHALLTCLLAGSASVDLWASETPRTAAASFLLEHIGLNTPSSLPFLPPAMLEGAYSPLGSSRYTQADGHDNAPALNGVSLALASYAAPGVWLDAGRFGIDGLSFCDPQSAPPCHSGLKSDYLLSPVGQGANRVALEARDDKTAAVSGAFASSSEDLDFNARGSHLQQTSFEERLLDGSDTEVLVALGASSLPGAKRKQRTELSWLYQDTELPVGGETLSRERQRVHLNHSANLNGKDASRTDLFWQESEISRTHETQLPGDSILGNPDAVWSVTGDQVRYQSYGIQSENRDYFGEHSLSYRIGYQRDSADYNEPDEPLEDTASVLELALAARFEMSWLTLDMEGSWIRADISRDSAEAGTDFRTEGWQYAVGLSMADERVQLWGRHQFVPASPGNELGLEQTADGVALSIHWPVGDLSLQGEVWAKEYDNLHLDCTELEDCDAIKGQQQLNVADVSATGLSLSVGWRGDLGGLRMPVLLALEENRAEFDSAQCLSAASRCFEEGESLPWQPERQLSLAVGLEAGEWSLSVTGRQIAYSEQELSRVDAELAWQVGSHKLYLRGENLTGEELPRQQLEFGPRDGEVLFGLGYRWQG